MVLDRSSSTNGIGVGSAYQPRGILMFARTLPSSSSLLLPAEGINPLCAGQRADPQRARNPPYKQKGRRRRGTQQEQPYRVKPPPHLVPRPPLGVALRIRRRGEHVAAPYGPGGRGGYGASECFVCVSGGGYWAVPMDGWLPCARWTYRG